MTEEEAERIGAILEKFGHLGQDDGIVIFSQQEAEILRRVASELDIETLKSLADVFNSMRGAVKVGGWLGSFLKWFVIVGAGVAAVRAGLLDWILSGVGK